MKLLLIITILLVSFGDSYTQGKWKRKKAEVQPLELFHSTNAITLPTAETIAQGDFLYGISHRFNLPISSGAEDLFGIDGSVSMRLKLGYAITDDLLVTLSRTNNFGLVDLEIKYKTFSIRHETFPTNIAAQVNVGTLTKDPTNLIKHDTQVNGALIINTLYDKSFGIGIMPQFLYNSHPECDEVDNSFLLGYYAQYYINDLWSVVAEANTTLAGYRNNYNSYAFGVEMETGGHFFKFIFTNNTKINLQQFNSGSLDSFNFNDLHFGFQITRNL